MWLLAILIALGVVRYLLSGLRVWCYALEQWGYVSWDWVGTLFGLLGWVGEWWLADDLVAYPVTGIRSVLTALAHSAQFGRCED
mgnify:CR=1 FL=1